MPSASDTLPDDEKGETDLHVHYLVAFRITSARREVLLVDALRMSDAWWNDIPSVWVVCTKRSADDLYSDYASILDLSENAGDFIWIRELTQGHSQQGWLPKAGWDWLRGHL